MFKVQRLHFNTFHVFKWFSWAMLASRFTTSHQIHHLFFHQVGLLLRIFEDSYHWRALIDVTHCDVLLHVAAFPRVLEVIRILPICR